MSTNQTQEWRTDQLAPHSIEAEEAVLGAILINPEALLEVLSFLKSEEFFIVRHAWIYEVVLALHDRRDPVDYLMVVHELEQRGQLNEIGGAAYVLSLINKTPSALNVEGYGRIVQRMAWRRRVIEFASQTARLAHSDETSIPTIHQKIVTMLNQLSGGVLHGPRTTSDLAGEFIDEAGAIVRGEASQAGWTTGFAMLDRLLEGAYGPGNMTVIGGYTNQGKTQIACQMAMAASRQGPVLYVTLESSPKAIFNRLVAAVCSVPLTRVMRRDLAKGEDLNRAFAAANDLSRLPIEIETLESLGDIESYMADMSVRYGFAPGTVFVDDVDSLAESMRGSNDYERQKRAAVGLLRLTLRTGWGVVALKQLLMPTEAKNVTSSSRLLEILKPTIMSFEGGRTISQKGGNVVTMLSAEWIQAKVYAEFRHSDLQEGYVYFWKHKARDARSDSVVEVPLRFNADIPRYEDIPMISAADLDRLAGEQKQRATDRRVYGQSSGERDLVDEH